jgi:hypothetical protein
MVRAWNGWNEQAREASTIDEQQWTRYLRLLACHENAIPSACVGCWYEQHAADEAFPGDRVSSTLCHMHLVALPMEVKCPDTLGQRR